MLRRHRFALAALTVFAVRLPAAAQTYDPAVLCPSLCADWIEELYTEGITAGCAGGAP